MKIHQHSQALINSIKVVDFFLVAGLLYLLAAAKYFYFGGGLHPDLHVTVALEKGNLYLPEDQSNDSVTEPSEARF